MRDTTAVRMQLEEQLASLEERGSRIEAHQQNVDREVPKDWQEQASFRGNDEVVDRLEEHTRREILAIRAALKRMDDGIWGECLRCGEEISDQRLQALPTAALCVKCAEEARP